ncbi:hypothetical protein [Burkholderia glumae]|uniref:TraG/VirB4 family ATPase n=1 Tax=Burkholderia glumae TaxID=337 RepID=UPI002151B0A3|nr:hypothetical protein [Burkholderia glumae]
MFTGVVAPHTNRSVLEPTNYNGFVDGTSGAGKSVLMNEIIAAFRAVGGVVRLTDVGYSYEKQ